MRVGVEGVALPLSSVEQRVGSCFMWRELPLSSHLSPRLCAHSYLSGFCWCFRVNMVQKYQSPVRIYKYPFELVMAVSDP